MFEGKTLVAVGCSHVFAPLGEDENPITCHERSWVKKLEKIGNFEYSINLSQVGASNQRSERVLMEYLESNDTDNLVVVFALTDLSRFEISETTDYEPNHVYSMRTIGPWSTLPAHTPDERILRFIETFYAKFHSSNYQTVMLNRKLLHLNSFLNKLNIEHYFVELHVHGGSIVSNKFGINLPLIHFKDINGDQINGIRYIMSQGYKPDYTGHFDHDAHTFLAELFYNQIKGMKNV